MSNLMRRVIRAIEVAKGIEPVRTDSKGNLIIPMAARRGALYLQHGSKLPGVRAGWLDHKGNIVQGGRRKRAA